MSDNFRKVASVVLVGKRLAALARNRQHGEVFEEDGVSHIFTMTQEEAVSLFVYITYSIDSFDYSFTVCCRFWYLFSFSFVCMITYLQLKMIQYHTLQMFCYRAQTN